MACSHTCNLSVLHCVLKHSCNSIYFCNLRTAGKSGVAPRAEGVNKQQHTLRPFFFFL